MRLLDRFRDIRDAEMGLRPYCAPTTCASILAPKSARLLFWRSNFYTYILARHEDTYGLLGSETEISLWDRLIIL